MELPVGTQVMVEGRGDVGRVVESLGDPEAQYLVEFANGDTAVLRRDQLQVMREFVREGLEAEAAVWEDWRPYVINVCVIGSRAYGLEHEGSDTDRRGIYLPPADLGWSLQGVPEQVEAKETQECYWELKKFVTLALKANPNILECLYTPLVEKATPLAADLIAMRQSFLSQLVYQTYNGYVLSQFRKISQDLRATGNIRWKHAMHLIRLLLSGIGTLREGAVPIHVEGNREALLAIRRGELPWEQVDAWRLRLHREFEEAMAATRLPERPDYARANAFLLRARRESL